MSARQSAYENRIYVERRMRQADEDNAQLDARAAQHARRYAAINRAVERMRRAIVADPINFAAAEIMHGLINELGRANEVRERDESPNESEVAESSPLVVVVAAAPLKLAILSEDESRVEYSI